MKPYWTDKVLASLLLAALTFATGCSGVGAQPPDAPDQSGSPPFSNAAGVGLSKGTPIYVHLEQPISSSTAEPGQNFSAVLDEALIVNGRIVAPEGTVVSGRVVAARKSGRLHDAGYVRLTLFSLNINGKEIPIQTSSVFVEGRSYKNHSLGYAGAGTGGNALMALAEAGDGGLISSGSTDSDGASAAYVNGKKEVGFAAERRMSFRLIEPLNIS